MTQEEMMKKMMEKLDNMEKKVNEIENGGGTIRKLVKVGAILAKKADQKANESLDKFIDRLENGTPEQPKQEVNSIVIKNGDINIYRGGKQPVTIRNKECVNKILDYIEGVLK